MLQRNENKLDKMCEIMDKLHEYVPVRQVTESFDAFGDSDPIEMDECLYHQILLGGDQLTVARA